MTDPQSSEEALGTRLPPEGKEDTSEDGSQTNSSTVSLVHKPNMRLMNQHLSAIQEKAQALITNSTFNKSITSRSFCNISELSSDEIEQYLIYLLWKKQEISASFSVKLKSDAKSVKLALKAHPSYLELPLPDTKVKYDKESCELQSSGDGGDDEITQINPKLSESLESNADSIYKIFRGISNECDGTCKQVDVAVCSDGIFFVPKRFPNQGQCILFEHLESVLIGKFDQWVVIRSTEGTLTKHIDIGDSQITKELLESIELCGRRRIERLKTPSEGRPLKLFWTPYFERMHNEPDVLEKALKKADSMHSRTTVLRSWLVLRENGEIFERVKENSFCLEGHFMLRTSGIFSKWNPAYFILTEKLLYHFLNVSDDQPKWSIPTTEITACEELPQSLRPHSFQINLKNGKHMQLGSPDQMAALQWRQKLNHIINQQTKPCPPLDRSVRPSYIVLTTSGLLMLDELGSTLIHRIPSVSHNKTPLSANRVCQSKHLPSLYGYNRRRFCRQKDSDELSNVSHFGYSSLQSRASTPVENPPSTPSEYPPSVMAPLDVASAVYLDQISSVNVSDVCPSACIIELECIDALVVVHDWVLHFRTEQELASFLAITLKYYKKATYKKDSIIQKLAPNLDQFLVEGSALASDYWD